MGREKQVAAKGLEVGIRTAPADKGRTGNGQSVVVNRVEHPQPGIGAVARHQNHLDPGAAEAVVEVQEFLHQRKSIAGLKDFVFVFDLILPVGFDAARQIDLVAFAQIKQRPRRNRQHQLVVNCLWHALPPQVGRLRCCVDQ
ncbi:hypothetical protein D9M73_152460 [compost metagenome]